jgi:N-acetylglutamate synthase-like GNAT family acetyltransferase
MTDRIPTTTIEYGDDAPGASEYHALFETTGWNAVYRVAPDELAEAVRRSWYVTTAREAGELVGCGRLVSDGALYAVVFDMIVAPRLRGRGIGSAILGRLRVRCETAGIRDILLFAARGTEGFYRRHGFAPRPGDAPGMILRRARREVEGAPR